MLVFPEDQEKYEAHPENPLEWTVMGMASTATLFGDENALEYYDIAIGLDSEYAFPYYEKAFSLFILQRTDEAQECLDKAVEINPQYKPLAKKLRSDFIREES